MPRLLRWSLLLTLALCTIDFPARAQPQKDRHVILISLDGFPAYAFDDPRLPIPTLRKLAREGVVAASMRPVNPTVTWPNHTAIATGVDASEHHVLFNGLLTRARDGAQPVIEPWRDKDLMVHAPTIYDVAYEAGLTTAQVDWVAIYGAKTITWQFPELPDPNGPIERELIADGMVTAEQLKTFENSSQAWQDEIWTDAAVKILAQHKPNLLLFHLLGLDDANHQYGPMSPASFTAMALLDKRVKQIVNALERAGLRSNATLMIVSDHGFRPVQHKVHPNVLLRENGILRAGQGKPTSDAWVMSTGGTAMVYLADGAHKVTLLPALRTIFRGAEGIDQVYGIEDFAKLGLPAPAMSDQAPDLVLAAKPGYSFANESEGPYVTPSAEGGTHGYPNTDPKMQAIFMAWGAVVPKGVHLENITNLDVAPTIANILGLHMKQARGHAIKEIVDSGLGQSTHP